MLTWCAWWSAALLDRVKIQESGGTAYELYTGHLAMVPMAAFGEKILWRLPRAVSGAGKFDSEWQDGVFVGISGPQVTRKELSDRGMCGGWSTDNVGINNLLIHARRHLNRI